MKSIISVLLLFYSTASLADGIPSKRSLCEETRVMLEDAPDLGYKKGDCVLEMRGGGADSLIAGLSCCYPGFYEYWFKNPCPEGTQRADAPGYSSNSRIFFVYCEKEVDGNLVPEGPSRSWSIDTKKPYMDFVFKDGNIISTKVK